MTSSFCKTNGYELSFDNSSTFQFSASGAPMMSISPSIISINSPLEMPLVNQSGLPIPTSGNILFYYFTSGSILPVYYYFSK